jgi:hypothetical protein
MPFSLTSYLLGVGIVVGALAFGFGGGVLLTNTAMKQTRTEPTRVERVARSEPEPTPTPQAANPQATNPQATDPQAGDSQAMNAKENPAAPVEPAPAARPDPVPAVQAATPKADGKPGARREPESAKTPVPTRQAEPANQTAPSQTAPSQTRQREAEQKKAADRKIERQKRYAERRTREVVVDRRSGQPDEPEQHERQGFAFGREAPRFEERSFDLFQFLKPQPSRSDYLVPVDRDD